MEDQKEVEEATAEALKRIQDGVVVHAKVMHDILKAVISLAEAVSDYKHLKSEEE